MSVLEFLGWATGFMAACGAFFGAVVGAVKYVRNGAKRDASATRLTEAQDSQQITEMALDGDLVGKWQKRFVMQGAELDAALETIRKLRAAELERATAESQAIVAEMKKERDRAVRMLAPDEVAMVFVPSEFNDGTGVLRPAPVRATPAPSDPFQANVVYGGRRAGDPPIDALLTPEGRTLRKDET